MPSDEHARRIHQARNRAKANGLIPIRRNWKLVCRNCEYEDSDAFAISPCPNCGSGRTAAAPDSMKEMINELCESGMGIRSIAHELNVNESNVHDWKHNQCFPNKDSHEDKLLQLHSERVIEGRKNGN